VHREVGADDGSGAREGGDAYERIAYQQFVPRLIHNLCIRQLRGDPRMGFPHLLS